LEVLMVWSFVYLALHRLLELMVLCWRSTDAKEVEILALWGCPDFSEGRLSGAGK
jgi:hypothetical protein